MGKFVYSPHSPSSPRRRGSNFLHAHLWPSWIPAFAGMTGGGVVGEFKKEMQNLRKILPQQTLYVTDKYISFLRLIEYGKPKFEIQQYQANAAYSQFNCRIKLPFCRINLSRNLLSICFNKVIYSAIRQNYFPVQNKWAFT
jgi:hypothetical protein